MTGESPARAAAREFKCTPFRFQISLPCSSSAGANLPELAHSALPPPLLGGGQVTPPAPPVRATSPNLFTSPGRQSNLAVNLLAQSRPESCNRPASAQPNPLGLATELPPAFLPRH